MNWDAIIERIMWCVVCAIGIACITMLMIQWVSWNLH